MTRRTLGLVVAASMLAGCASDTGHDSRSSAPSTPPTFAPATFPPSTTTQPVATTATPGELAPAGVTEPADTTARGQLAELERLVVAPENDDASYDRNLFGGGWIDADGNGCNTRCEVLEAERTTLPGGVTGWLSAYDDYSTDDASELDIDHMVPLAEAWRSGASTWDPARRIAYANDLDAPMSLIAVTAATNRAKGDKDPARWQPSNLDAWCSYTAAWIATKQKWELTADAAEVKALRNMIQSRSC